ncbi:hypothetical protein COHA_007221 [Chlorella ohadii]|uniref:Uncharacterized protein n=1 Tax=Chlorella ohadii TaxID=2649997 RepID=A0AAD5DMI2_9CHLO|nr:hypothetical protein COHA_007221 [Chlorella ohadii]
MLPRRTARTLLALLAAAALVACAAAERPPSHRRRLNGDARSVSFVWSTDATTSLHLTGTSNSHGKLYVGPPSDIPPNAKDWKAGYAASKGFMTGVEGDLQFSVNLNSGTTTGCSLNLHYDCPFVGANSYSCSVGGGQACQQAIGCALSGGIGNNAELNISVYAK